MAGQHAVLMRLQITNVKAIRDYMEVVETLEEMADDYPWMSDIADAAETLKRIEGEFITER